jgi:NAD(P)H-hydrate epimerase
MNTPALTRQQCRDIDRLAIEKYGVPGIVLMENAGRGCVDVIERIGIHGLVDILCGTGNNGGDGFVIARHLHTRGYECRVTIIGHDSELKGEAAVNYEIIDWFDFPNLCLQKTLRDMKGSLDRLGRDSDWLVDALLGTGAVGEPRPPFDTAIDWMNARSSSTKLLAVDVPSGLDCDTGQPSQHTIRADHTCTFAAMKIGFLQPAAKPYTGQVHVCDIGIPIYASRSGSRPPNDNG